MTEGSEPTGGERQRLADAFETDPDPLAAHADTFDALDVDPFALFRDEVLAEQELADGTYTKYDRVIDQWCTHMAHHERHPACPTLPHVHAFADHCQTERGNQPDTVRTKLRRLNRAYEYWQRDPVFPHERGFNPFTLTLATLDLSRPPSKEPHRIPVEELAAVLESITDVRDRAIITAQLKLGLRASELCNLRLAELHLADPGLTDGYPELGTHEALNGRPNAVYVASRHERQGNKSRRARVLPIDTELQDVLRAYLLVRPDPAHRSVFLSKSTHTPIDGEYVNRVWRTAFHPAYDETDQHRAVTSHFGRHRFTTYWQVEQDAPRELVKYLRGDRVDGVTTDREAIDDYIHTYYEDIESLYRNRIYRFDLSSAPAPDPARNS